MKHINQFMRTYDGSGDIVVFHTCSAQKSKSFALRAIS